MRSSSPTPLLEAIRYYQMAKSTYWSKLAHDEDLSNFLERSLTLLQSAPLGETHKAQVGSFTKSLQKQLKGGLNWIAWEQILDEYGGLLEAIRTERDFRDVTGWSQSQRGRRTLMGTGIFLAVFSLCGWAYFQSSRIWSIQYFANTDLSGTPIRSLASTLDFRWNQLAPKKGIPPNHFSLRARSCLKIQEPGEYKFEIASDDGSRILIDGQVVVDNWGVHAITVGSGVKQLASATHPIEIEYFNAQGPGQVKFKIHGGKYQLLRENSLGTCS